VSESGDGRQHVVQYLVTATTAMASPTAVVRQATTWQEFPTVWRSLLDEVYAFLKDSAVKQAGHNIMLYKDDVPNVEVGVQVATRFSPRGRVVPSVLPAGEVAMTVHRGPYHGLGAAHQAVWEWSAAQGRELAGPRWEIYGDWREDPAELVTEVYYLLR
jgi:effector-binding domain-containing protein